LSGWEGFAGIAGAQSGFCRFWSRRLNLASAFPASAEKRDYYHIFGKLSMVMGVKLGWN
jgi:hypothetical protein